MGTGITVSNYHIANGNNSIFGKLYAPNDNAMHPAIILSHGYNGIGDDFVNECTYFANNGYIAFAYDFCGGSVRSRSTGKSTDMTLFTEKSDLLAVFDFISSLDNVDKANVFLFGGSQGGLVTTLACEEIADKVKGMALYYPAFCIADNWRDNFKTTDEIPAEHDFWGLNLGKIFFTAMRDLYVFDTIGSFPKDVLIIHGDQDTIVSQELSKKAATHYPSAKLIILEGEGHGFSPEGGEIAMKHVLDYLNSHTN